MRLLVVEDDQEMTNLFNQLFTSVGHEACYLPHGEQFFESIEYFKPDIILLDQLLPGKTGQELLQEMRQKELYREIPVIIVTGLDADNEQLKGLENGADDYIVKPFAPGVLLARIEAILRRYHGHNTNNIVCKELSINFDTHKVVLSGKEIRKRFNHPPLPRSYLVSKLAILS